MASLASKRENPGLFQDHSPPGRQAVKGQVTVRYYDLYANAHRGKVRKSAAVPPALATCPSTACQRCFFKVQKDEWNYFLVAKDLTPLTRVHFKTPFNMCNI
jgi:hypothetical protein